MAAYFVTGTDTGVGKTRVTEGLLLASRERGLRVAGYKPICCGDREDARKLLAASSPGLAIDEVNPVWLALPAAPWVAARAEGQEIDWPRLLTGAHSLTQRHDIVFVEGVGGWKVPISHRRTAADLAKDLAFPVLVVAANRLGVLNHALLTMESIAASGLTCAGVILNQVSAEADVTVATNAEVIRRETSVPILAELPFRPAASAFHELADSLDRSLYGAAGSG